MFEHRHTEAYAHKSLLRLWERGRNVSCCAAQRVAGSTVVAAVLAIFLSFSFDSTAQTKSSIYKKDVIKGGISPKSVVSSGGGIFAAQNMMYRHTITLYDETGRLLAKIKDKVDLKEYGFEKYESKEYLGGPVEAVFSHSGKYLWVSQYSMIGKEFKNPGCDACAGKSYDPSFVYKINTTTKQVENVIEVGAVPKFMAISADESKIIVSNWSSSDVSIIDTKEEKEVKRVDVGVHPRGIAIKSDGSEAFVTIMGSTKIARINLSTFDVTYITDVGRSPRHLVLSADDKYLYCSVNSSNKVVKINLENQSRTSCYTKSGPRTMVLSDDQRYLYVVNYFANTFSKIQTDSMIVKEEISTSKHPIGICGNWDTGELWVACYSGSIEIFRDFDLKPAEDDHLLALNGGLKDWLDISVENTANSSKSIDNNQSSKEIDKTLLAVNTTAFSEELTTTKSPNAKPNLRENKSTVLARESDKSYKRNLKKAKVIDTYKSEDLTLNEKVIDERAEAVDKQNLSASNSSHYKPIETKANFAPVKKVDFLAIRKDIDRKDQLLAMKEAEKEKIEVEEIPTDEVLAVEAAEIIPEVKDERPVKKEEDVAAVKKDEAPKAMLNGSGPKTLASANKFGSGLISKSSHKKEADKFNPTGCTFHVIVGSFSEVANAEQFAEEMKSKGYPAQVVEGSSLTYVSAQCYTTTANATQGVKDIEEETGIEGWVLERD